MAVFNNMLAGAAGQSGGASANVADNFSLRFNSADSASLTRAVTTKGNTKKFTFSCWVKRTKLGAFPHNLLSGSTGTDQGSYLCFPDNASNALGTVDSLVFKSDNAAGGGSVRTQAVFRDPSAWYHVVLAVDTTQATDSNRVKIWVNGVLQTLTTTASPGWPNLNSELSINDVGKAAIGAELNDPYGTRFHGDFLLAEVHFLDGQVLTPSSFGATDVTTGVWNPITVTGVTYGTNGYYLDFLDNSSTTSGSNVGIGKDVSGNGNYFTSNNISVWNGGAHQYSSTLTTSGSWAPGYEPARSFNGDTTTNAAGGSGGEINTWDASSYNITVNTSLRVYAYTIFDDWLVNGTSQGAITSTGWKTASLTPPYTLSSIVSDAPGSHGSYFSAIEVDGVVLIDKTSPVNDSLADHPTNGDTANDGGFGGEVSGNFCTWNPLRQLGSNTVSNGNLDVTLGNTVTGTFAQSSGKWYWEITYISATQNALGVGIIGASVAQGTMSVFGGGAVGYYLGNGSKYVDGASTGYGASATAGNVIGVALDLDSATKTITFYKNGSSQGAITLPSSDSVWSPAVTNGTGGGTQSLSANFGQRAFAYSAPSGFKALCTANLSNPAVADGSTVFDVLTYSGNGGVQNINGLTFEPDLVWIKCRSTAYGHRLTDQVRGATVKLQTDSDAGESAESQGLTAFTGTGFTLNLDPRYNNSPDTYVAWNWKAGGEPTTDNIAGAGNVPTAGSVKIDGANMTTSLAGSIPATRLSANTAAGFSIVGFTCPSSGAYSFAHGLGVKPSLVIMKGRDTAGNIWAVYHSSVNTYNDYLGLSSTAGITSSPGIWGGGIDSTVVGSTANNGVAANTNAVAYCFAPVEGFSAMGAFAGNNLADGPFIYTGFTPRFILVKPYTFAESWYIWDTARTPYNVTDKVLFTNSANGGLTYEGTNDSGVINIDILSNGWKIRGPWVTNNPGQSNVWMAFAENPFKYARAR